MKMTSHAFSYELFGTKTCFARGKSQLFIHELLREPLIKIDAIDGKKEVKFVAVQQDRATLIYEKHNKRNSGELP